MNPIPDTQIVPAAEPFLLRGDRTGCLLVHGFTSMPEEMRLLGDYLNEQGRTVLGIRLAGHATQPIDLARTIWTDWLANVEDGLAVLRGVTDRVFLIGQSMGGMIVLLSAARYPVAGVVALSTPADLQPSPLPRGRLVHKWGPKAKTAYDGRRELNYPAYPSFPPTILREMKGLSDTMMSELGNIQVPVLLMHSDSDQGVPFNSMQKIYDQLTTPKKQMIPLSGMDHSVVRDPQRAIVFEAVNRFIENVPAAS